MRRTTLADHRYYTTVASAHAAAHDSLDRDLARTPMFSGDPCGGRQHAFGAAGVNHHGTVRIEGREPAIERSGNSAALADAAVLGRQFERHTQLLEEIQIEQFRRPTCAVEQGCLDLPRAKPFGQ